MRPGYFYSDGKSRKAVEGNSLDNTGGRETVFECTGAIKLGETDQETEWEIYRSASGKGRESKRSESIFSGSDSGGMLIWKARGEVRLLKSPGKVTLSEIDWMIDKKPRSCYNL